MKQANGGKKALASPTSAPDPSSPSSKKRRLGADLQNTGDDTAAGTAPAMDSTDTNTKPSVVASEADERTSKDYYFDSYAHHAIRK